MEAKVPGYWRCCRHEMREIDGDARCYWQNVKQPEETPPEMSS